MIKRENSLASKRPGQSSRRRHDLFNVSQRLGPRLPASHVLWTIVSGHQLYASNWAGSCRIRAEPDSVSALLKLLFHEGSCKTPVIR